MQVTKTCLPIAPGTRPTERAIVPTIIRKRVLVLRRRLCLNAVGVDVKTLLKQRAIYIYQEFLAHLQLGNGTLTTTSRAMEAEWIADFCDWDQPLPEQLWLSVGGSASNSFLE